MPVPEYTVASVVGVVCVLAAERWWLRTGLLRDRAYWISMGIVAFFMVLVDGWLTKLSAPIVLYSGDEFSGVRFPWSIPVEDYLFGFSLVTLTMLMWDRRRTLDGDA